MSEINSRVIKIGLKPPRNKSSQSKRLFPLLSPQNAEWSSSLVKSASRTSWKIMDAASYLSQEERKTQEKFSSSSHLTINLHCAIFSTDESLHSNYRQFSSTFLFFNYSTGRGLKIKFSTTEYKDF